MNKNISYLTCVLLTIFFVSCERDTDGFDPATAPTTPDVFIDAFSGGLNYAAFGGSDVRAFDVDTEVKYKGSASMRFAVPDVNDPAGAYAGGTYFTSTGRDLSGYNVLTFWAKASKAANIDVLGIGNDLGENKYQASITNVAVNTNWKQYFIPIPDPSKLISERGMFFYSEGAEEEKGYTFWIDEVRFESLGTLGKVRGTIMDGNDDVITAETGNTYDVTSAVVANLPSTVDQVVQASPDYFTYTSSDPQVASVDDNGKVKVMSAGTAVIEATINGEKAKGSLTINSTGDPVLPQTKAPMPTLTNDKVISVYSNAYTNVPVDFYNGYWQFSTTQSQEVKVEDDDILKYSQLNFVGIQFTAPTINATAMNGFHIDIWTPDDVNASTTFKVLLVDVGADKSFGTNDDSSHELTIPVAQLKKEQWVSLDLPFSSFPGLTSKNNLAQIVLSGSLPNVFVDNMYFYNDGNTGGGGDPTEAAPTPTRVAANVISIFSNAYTNVADTDFNPNWGQATVVSQVTIGGNNTLKYTGLNYQGIQLGSSQDVSEMEFLHLDYWTANSSTLNVFLISPGPTETAFGLQVPTSGWKSIDIPLTVFAGVDLKDIIQFKFDGNGTIYLDNLYFYKEGGSGGGDEPTTAAPTPNRDPASVKSLFSDAYINLPVDTWRTDWSQATFEDVNVAGNAVKKYSALDFVGIETIMNQIDVSDMTHVHLDIWSPDFDFFAIKLVDFGPDGAFGGGDDKEHQLDYDMPAQKQWVSLDIPLADFIGLTTKNNMAQYILVGRPTANTTVYMDNFYFYK